MNECILVLTTMPADDRTDDLARMLVEERLAACVTVHEPMSSTYRWHDGIETARERQLVIKTARRNLTALEARLRALHPYELPELIVLTAAASDAYAAWIDETTRSG